MRVHTSLPHIPRVVRRRRWHFCRCRREGGEHGELARDHRLARGIQGHDYVPGPGDVSVGGNLEPPLLTPFFPSLLFPFLSSLFSSCHISLPARFGFQTYHFPSVAQQHVSLR